MKIHALLQLSAFGFGMIASGIEATAPLLEVKESIAIAVPPELAWKMVGNFKDLGWHPAVDATQISVAGGSERQAIRTLRLKDGGTIVEQLCAQDDDRMSQRYAMLESPLPVTDYEATITVNPDGAGSSQVIWQARFRRKEETASDDASVAEIVRGIFSSGLTALKKELQTQQ